MLVRFVQLLITVAFIYSLRIVACCFAAVLMQLLCVCFFFFFSIRLHCWLAFFGINVNANLALFHLFTRVFALQFVLVLLCRRQLRLELNVDIDRYIRWINV